MSPITLAIVGLQAQRANCGTIVSAFLGAYKKPIVFPPIIRVIFVFTGIKMPEPLEHSFLLTGEESGGAGLFLTGLVLSGQKPHFDRRDRRIAQSRGQGRRRAWCPVCRTARGHRAVAHANAPDSGRGVPRGSPQARPAREDAG